MKIAVYADLPKGGASSHTLGMLKEYQRKHKVTVFSPQPPRVTSRLGKDLLSIFWAKKEAIRFAKIINDKFDLAYVTHDRFFQAPWILRYLKIPNIFYCHEPTRAYFEPELGIDKSWPFTNRLYEFFIRLIKKRIEIKNASYAKDVRVNSLYSQMVIKKVYNLESRVEYPQVDKSVFKKRKLKKKYQILWIGNDEPQKRLKLAIDALSMVKDSPTLLVISPRFPVPQNTRDHAKFLGVKLVSRVGVSSNELVKAYNESILTLATSLREPFGYTPIESLACGTPVVAVNEGAFPETLRGKKNVVLVNAKAQEIAKAIRIFI